MARTTSMYTEIEESEGLSWNVHDPLAWNITYSVTNDSEEPVLSTAAVRNIARMEPVPVPVRSSASSSRRVHYSSVHSVNGKYRGVVSRTKSVRYPPKLPKSSDKDNLNWSMIWSRVEDARKSKNVNSETGRGTSPVNSPSTKMVSDTRTSPGESYTGVSPSKLSEARVVNNRVSYVRSPGKR